MARYRLESGPIPLHHQVYLDLAEALDGGEWKQGDRLPTERELAGRYGCSLITVRRALDELAREGRLERARGRGTFAAEPPMVRDLAGRAGFADEMRARGRLPYTAVVAARLEPSSPAVAAGLGIAVAESVHFLERVRGADRMPMLLEQAWLPAARFPGLLDEDYEHRSLYEVLESAYACPILRTRETITAFTPNVREARLLSLRNRRPAIQLEGTAFSRHDEIVEYSRTVVSSERARYYIETSGSRARSVLPFDAVFASSVVEPSSAVASGEIAAALEAPTATGITEPSTMT